jgi:cytochrome c
MEKRLAMVGRCIGLAVGSLVLCFAGPTGAQDRAKALYASQCERCHKSPQGVTTFHGGVDLETFLGELHYADTPESAANIAAYLRGLERKRPTHRRQTEHRGEANPSQPAPRQPVPTNADSSEDDPVKRTLKKLFGGANQ